MSQTSSTEGRDHPLMPMCGWSRNQPDLASLCVKGRVAGSFQAEIRCTRHAEWNVQ